MDENKVDAIEPREENVEKIDFDSVIATLDEEGQKTIALQIEHYDRVLKYLAHIFNGLLYEEKATFFSEAASGSVDSALEFIKEDIANFIATKEGIPAVVSPDVLVKIIGGIQLNVLNTVFSDLIMDNVLKEFVDGMQGAVLDTMTEMMKEEEEEDTQGDTDV